MCPAIFVGFFILLGLPTDAFAHAPHNEVQAILLSPAFLRDAIVFAIVRHNILRSTDFGYTWRRLTRGLGACGFLDIAISPAFASDRSLFAASRDGGVFRSRDGGAYWAAINAGLEQQCIAFLAISPDFATDRRLVAGGGETLHVSDDGGDTWRVVLRESGGVSAATVIEGTIVVGTAAGSVRASVDGGATWRDAVRCTAPITCFARLDRPSAEPTLVAGTGGGAVALTRGRNTWQVRKLGPNGQYITSLAAAAGGDGAAPILFASTWNDGVFRSEDGGVSWQRKSQGLTKDEQADRPGFRRPHFRGLAVSSSYASDSTIFAGGFDGVFKSVDGGERWRELRDVLPIGLVVGLDAAPLDGEGVRIAITTYVAGTYALDPGGRWEAINRGIEGGGGRLFAIVHSPAYASDRTMFALGNWSLFKSTDGGRHWTGTPLHAMSHTTAGFKSRLRTAVRRGVKRIAAALGDHNLLKLQRRWLARRAHRGAWLPGYGGLVAISPGFLADGTLFVGGRHGVLRSRDGGASLQYVLGPDHSPVHSLAVSPDFQADGTAFAAFADSVRRSTDGGFSWEPIEVARELRSPRLAVSPAYARDGTVFLGDASGLWRSRNRGGAWEGLCIGELRTGVSIDGLAISPFFERDGEILVHARGVGLFRSRDGGDTFTAAGASPHDDGHPLSHMTDFPDRAPLIRFSPRYDRDHAVYASSVQDLLRSLDGGESWQVLDRPVRFVGVRPEITYRGNWRTARDPTFDSASARRSSKPGDVAAMDFIGKAIRWIGMQGPTQGMATVRIDGSPVATVDQYAATQTFSTISFEAKDLPLGPHSISIEVRSERNRHSSGRDVTIDAFDVT